MHPIKTHHGLQILLAVLGLIFLANVAYHDPSPAKLITTHGLQDLLVADVRTGGKTQAPTGTEVEVSTTQAALALEPPCEEPAGDAVVTPCSDTFLYVQGSDREVSVSYNSLNSFYQSLISTGYEPVRFDFHNDPLANNLSPQSFATAMKSARTILFEGHGRDDGYARLACYGGDYGFGQKCCEKTKEFSQAFGFPTNYMNCNVAPEPEEHYEYADDLRMFVGEKRGFLETLLGESPCNNAVIPISRRGPGTSCIISFNSSVYTSLGDKALLVTPQCGGGGCWNADFSNIDDTWTHTPGPDVDSEQARINASLLAGDINGSNLNYLHCLPSSPGTVTDPFCVSSPILQDELRGLSFRNVQDSVEGRTSTSLDQGDFGVNNQGDQSYLDVAIRGNSNTAVEFTPTYSTIDYHPSTGQLALNFTSALKPESVTRPSISSPVPRAYSSLSSVEASGPRYTSTPHQIQANLTRLNGATPIYHLMTEEEWDRPDFETKYGHSRADWPYYTLVVFRGLTAPNGIKLAGNVSAELTDAELNNLPLWIWADQEHTLSFPSMDWCGDDGIPCGKAKYVGEVKGGTIAFKLPLQPHYSCCFQNTVTVGSESSHCINVDSHNLGTGISSTCRILTGPDANQVGTPHLWATCLNGEEYLTRMCPSGLPQGVSTFKAWPLDDGQPARDCWAGGCDSLTWIPDDPGAYQCPSYTEVMPTAGQGLGWPMCNGNQATASCVAGSNWCWATDHTNCQLTLKDCRSALVPSTRPTGLQPASGTIQPGSTIKPKSSNTTQTKSRQTTSETTSTWQQVGDSVRSLLRVK